VRVRVRVRGGVRVRGCRVDGQGCLTDGPHDIWPYPCLSHRHTINPFWTLCQHLLWVVWNPSFCTSRLSHRPRIDTIRASPVNSDKWLHHTLSTILAYRPNTLCRWDCSTRSPLMHLIPVLHFGVSAMRCELHGRSRRVHRFWRSNTIRSRYTCRQMRAP
jgi:hypothetical protein